MRRGDRVKPPSDTPELLAPAGDPRALRAALGAGADAVYFGLERWSARAFAGNFAPEQAVEAVELAHLHGARAYLAVNTLLKDDELEPALAALEAPYAAGLDALIVADLAFAARAREQYPGLPLHASTQLGTHSSAQLAMIARLGFSRAILARELSLGEITALDPHGLGLEAFVHGALCYGYSGDCLLSSMVGGRSGNRGRCSQSCRMRYRLAPAEARDGDPRADARPRARGPAAPDAASTSRLLSTADLCAIQALPRMLAAGVSSFKIEGRMKDAAYVAVTTSVYREALDAAAGDPEGYRVLPVWVERLEQAFSRGFTSAHLEGRSHEVRSGGQAGHRGVLVGRVERLGEQRGEVVVRLAKPVVAGDVVSLYTPWGQTEPVRVEEAAADRLTLRIGERAAVKDRVFRVVAAEADALAHDLVAGRALARPVWLTARLEGRAGEPARLTVRAEPGGPEVAVASDEALTPARTVTLDDARVREALGALGGTPYRLGESEVALGDGLFLSVGALKGLRRQAIAALDRQRLAARRRSPSAAKGVSATAPVSGATAVAAGSRPVEAAGRPTVSARRRVTDDGWPEAPVVLVVRPGEEPLPAPGVVALCLDLLASDPPGEILAAAGRLSAPGLPLRCRPPEVLFDGETAWWSAVSGPGARAAAPWAAIYVRHLGLIGALPAEADTILEYPLQGLSGDVAAVVAELAGRAPTAVVASPEASLGEVAGLAAGLERLDPPAAVEALAFGRQQVLRTRDQLGRAEGLYEAPGHGEHIALLLEDAKEYRFPAEVDAGGTRLFNARVTNLASNLGELRAAGVSACLVIQRDMNGEERRAFACGGLPALAPFVHPARSTTGHLFRGVA